MKNVIPISIVTRLNKNSELNIERRKEGSELVITKSNDDDNDFDHFDLDFIINVTNGCRRHLRSRPDGKIEFVIWSKNS